MEPRLRPERDVAETLVKTYQRYECNYSADLIKNIRELDRKRTRRPETVSAPKAVDVNVHIGPTEKAEDPAPPTIEQKFSKKEGDSVQ